MTDERLRDDPREVCDHCDEQGSTIMQAKDDRYECIVCGERFRLVLAATSETPTLDVERLAIAMSYVEMRTMASPTEPGPQTLRDAAAIATTYTRLMAEKGAR